LLAHQFPRARYDLSDELVAWRALETVVAAQQLDIGVADAGPQHPDQGKALPWRRTPRRPYSDLLVVEVNCQHSEGSGAILPQRRPTTGLAPLRAPAAERGRPRP